MGKERRSPSPRGGGSERASAPGRGGSITPSRLASSPHPAALTSGDPPPHGGGKAPNLVLLGEFGRAHGLKGEVRLKTHTGDPLAIADYELRGADGRRFILKNPRQAPGNTPDILVVQVKGVTTREAAEALNRVQLFVPRDQLPAAEDEDEFLLADLIGLGVRDVAGTVIGTIVDVPNFGGGDLLDIKPASGGASAYLPFTKAFVPEIHIADGFVVADLPGDFFAPAKPEPEEAP